MAVITVGVNAFIGLLLFEFAWYKTRRFRQPITELNAQFPELCRNDAPNWRKWKLYPGAVSLLVPRILAIFIPLAFMALFVNLFLCCHKPNRPLTGCRKVMVRGTFKFFLRLSGLFGWFTYFQTDYLSEEQVNHYEEYLGTRKE